MRDELKDAKENLFKERTEAHSAKNEEIRNLKDQVRDLERKLEQQSEEGKVQEQKYEQNKVNIEN